MIIRNILDWITFVILISSAIADFARFDYCNPKLCDQPWDVGKNHIGCHVKHVRDAFGADCGPNPVVKDITPDMKYGILQFHNKQRNKVAAGDMKGAAGKKLPKAVRMAYMSWDDELASLAKLSASQCGNEESFCRNTINFKASSINAKALSGNYTNDPNGQLLVIRALKSFGKQRSFLTAGHVKKYPGDAEASRFREYSTIIIDHNNKVGCAWVMTETKTHIACHYASKNMELYPIYKTGKTSGSKCKKKHPQFRHLCETYEDVDPNDTYEKAKAESDAGDDSPTTTATTQKATPSVETATQASTSSPKPSQEPSRGEEKTVESTTPSGKETTRPLPTEGKATTQPTQNSDKAAGTTKKSETGSEKKSTPTIKKPIQIQPNITTCVPKKHETKNDTTTTVPAETNTSQNTSLANTTTPATTNETAQETKPGKEGAPLDAKAYNQSTLPGFLNTLSDRMDQCDPCKSYIPFGVSMPLGCNVSLAFGPECGAEPMLSKLSSQEKDVVISAINTLRNIVANGESKGTNDQPLPSAAKMVYTQWDDELADLAALAAKECSTEFSRCASTKNFKAVGALIHLARTSPENRRRKRSEPKDVSQALPKRPPFAKYIEEAYGGRLNVPKELIESYSGENVTGDGAKFIAMVGDLNTKVGCAFSSWTKPSTSFHVLFVCFFSAKSHASYPVYKVDSKPASGCTKIHKVHSGLCDESEDIDPNAVYDDVQREAKAQFFDDNSLPDVINDIGEKANYCDPKLCDEHSKHIGCNLTMSFGSACGIHSLVVNLSEQQKKMIVERHNHYRNLTAGGDTLGDEGMLPKAIRMAYMQWDDELAALALLKVKECSDEHDSCHNTVTFQYSGQNLYSVNKTSAYIYAFDQILLESVDAWYKEAASTSAEQIRRFSEIDLPAEKKNGNFTALVTDRSTRVGCAASLYHHENHNLMLVACNYASTNMKNTSVYREGEQAGSKCEKTHLTYTNLCHEDEPIDPNNLNDSTPTDDLPRAKDVDEETRRKNDTTKEDDVPVKVGLGSEPKPKNYTKQADAAEGKDMLDTTTKPSFKESTDRPTPSEELPVDKDANKTRGVPDEKEEQVTKSPDGAKMSAVTSLQNLTEFDDRTLPLYLQSIANTTNYCNLDLCKTNAPLAGKPVACNFSMDFGEKCGNGSKVLVLSEEEKNSIVDAINNFRNTLAGGKTYGSGQNLLPKATRMGYVQWDEELANLAILAVKECKRIINDCAYTRSVKAADGIALEYTVSENWPHRAYFTQYINEAYSGAKFVTPQDIEAYSSSKLNTNTKNFLTLVADHSTGVGCSYVMSGKMQGRLSTNFICYFSSKNLDSYPVYKTGNISASDCNGTHAKFQYLCDSLEPINPNEHFETNYDKAEKQFYNSTTLPVMVEAIKNKTDYCNPDLCDVDDPHVACTTGPTFGPKCGAQPLVTNFTKAQKQSIVDQHNYYRNLTAAGQSIGEFGVQLPKAVRMAYMQWDDELAALALLNVKDCAYKHDLCHNTENYHYSGQNLYRMQSSVTITSFDERLLKAVDLWYNETQYTSVEQIKKYPEKPPPKKKTIGHFTALVTDRSNRVGCATSFYYDETNRHNMLMACNYASTNIQNYPVYRDGDIAASECKKNHLTYINLCHEDENIDPNDLTKQDTTVSKPENDAKAASILKPIISRNYCDPKLCNNKNHIGCNKTEIVGAACGVLFALHPMNPEQSEIIVNLHNVLRNQTAGGETVGETAIKLPKAVRMAEMQWDQELADLALLNVKECESKHDECRNTQKFIMAGQNIYNQWQSGSSSSVSELIQEGIIKWFNESLDTSAAMINSLPLNTKKDIGHFTAIVNDKSTRVGCGAISFRKETNGMAGTAFIFTCNYARGNLLDNPVYKTGNVSASDCKYKNKDYENLCGKEENIDPNEDLSSPSDDGLSSPEIAIKDLQDKQDVETSTVSPIQNLTVLDETSLPVYLQSISNELNHCNMDLCKSFKPFSVSKPISCNYTMGFDKQCGEEPKILLIPEEEKAAIVNAVNNYRNILAGGNTLDMDNTKFPIASRMAYVTWDDDLANLALLNVKECLETANICAYTRNFKAAGRMSFELKIQENESQTINFTHYINEAYSASSSIPSDSIEEYSPTDFDNNTINFIAMMADHNTRVGCSLGISTEQQSTTARFICYLSSQNIAGYPVYSTGDSIASDCSSVHNKYANLCDEFEPIDPNELFETAQNEAVEEFYLESTLPSVIEDIKNKADYCNAKLCDATDVHVACISEPTFGPKCGIHKLVAKLTDDQKETIVDDHNYYRNKTAGGHTVGTNGQVLPEAVRMAYMNWDDDLANLALLTVKECESKLDKCRSTLDYKHAGQNIYHQPLGGYVEDHIYYATDFWYSEAVFILPDQIEKLPEDTMTQKKNIDSFTNIVNDRNTRVGCALGFHYSNDEPHVEVICNYASTVFPAHRVYKVGDVASECKRTHPDYINLCHPDEPIDPNNLSDIAPSMGPLIENKDMISEIPLPKNATTIADVLKPIVDNDKYCDPHLCMGVKHIGCNNTENLGSACGTSPQLVTMNQDRIKIILDLHNDLRDQTAAGKTVGYGGVKLPIAVKMRAMEWDQKLADLALINVKECEHKYDHCHNTHEHKMSGQNIYMGWKALSGSLINDRIKDAFENWQHQSGYTSKDHINAYPSKKPEKDISKFTVIVNDKNSKVGCGGINFKEEKDGRHGTTFLFVCNYARTNVPWVPVYITGQNVSSKCTKNYKVYDHLCDTDEQVDFDDERIPSTSDTTNACEQGSVVSLEITDAENRSKCNETGKVKNKFDNEKDQETTSQKPTEKSTSLIEDTMIEPSDSLEKLTSTPSPTQNVTTPATPDATSQSTTATSPPTKVEKTPTSTESTTSTTSTTTQPTAATIPPTTVAKTPYSNESATTQPTAATIPPTTVAETPSSTEPTTTQPTSATIPPTTVAETTSSAEPTTTQSTAATIPPTTVAETPSSSEPTTTQPTDATIPPTTVAETPSSSEPTTTQPTDATIPPTTVAETPSSSEPTTSQSTAATIPPTTVAETPSSSELTTTQSTAATIPPTTVAETPSSSEPTTTQSTDATIPPTTVAETPSSSEPTTTQPTDATIPPTTVAETPSSSEPTTTQSTDATIPPTTVAETTSSAEPTTTQSTAATIPPTTVTETPSSTEPTTTQSTAATIPPTTVVETPSSSEPTTTQSTAAIIPPTTVAETPSSSEPTTTQSTAATIPTTTVAETPSSAEPTTTQSTATTIPPTTVAKTTSSTEPTTTQSTAATIPTTTVAETPSSAEPTTTQSTAATIPTTTVAETPSSAEPTTTQSTATTIPPITVEKTTSSTESTTTQSTAATIPPTTVTETPSSTEPTTTQSTSATIPPTTVAETPSSAEPTTTQSTDATIPPTTVAETTSSAEPTTTQSTAATIPPTTVTETPSSSEPTTTQSTAATIPPTTVVETPSSSEPTTTQSTAATIPPTTVADTPSSSEPTTTQSTAATIPPITVEKTTSSTESTTTQSTAATIPPTTVTETPSSTEPTTTQSTSATIPPTTVAETPYSSEPTTTQWTDETIPPTTVAETPSSTEPTTTQSTAATIPPTTVAETTSSAEPTTTQSTAATIPPITVAETPSSSEPTTTQPTDATIPPTTVAETPSSSEPTTTQSTAATIPPTTVAETPSSSEPTTTQSTAATIPPTTVVETPSSSEPTTTQSTAATIPPTTVAETPSSAEPTTTQSTAATIPPTTVAETPSSFEPTTTQSTAATIPPTTVAETPSSFEPTTTQPTAATRPSTTVARTPTSDVSTTVAPSLLTTTAVPRRTPRPRTDSDSVYIAGSDYNEVLDDDDDDGYLEMS